MIRRCRCCDRRKEVKQVMKFGNGTYRRGGHFRRASICEACARLMLQDVHEGQMQTNRWSVRGLRREWKIEES